MTAYINNLKIKPASKIFCIYIIFACSQYPTLFVPEQKHDISLLFSYNHKLLFLSFRLFFFLY